MYSVTDLPGVIPIGRQGENGVVRVGFDLTPWTDVYPGIACAITLQDGQEEAPFPVTGVTQSESSLYWLVGREATVNAGLVDMVVRGYAGDREVRSARTRALIDAGQTASGDAPDAVADWVGEATVLRAAVEAQYQTVADAEAARSVYEMWDVQKRYTRGSKVAVGGRSYVWTAAEPSLAGLQPPAEGWLLIADRGDMYLAGFHIDAQGQLIVEYSDGYDGPTFAINENGELEVLT